MIVTDEEKQVQQDKREKKIQAERRLQTIMLSFCTLLSPLIATGFWWCAQQLSAVPSLSKSVADLEMRVYPRIEAKKDLEAVTHRIDTLEAKDEGKDVKIENIDRRLLLIETNAAIKGGRK